MKIAVAQINTTIGDFEGNLNKISAHIEKAKKSRADLVIFPEMAVTSYPPRDLLEMRGFVRKNLETLNKLATRCSGIGAIVGFVSENKKAEGKPLFNSAAFIANKKVAFVQHKSLLPSYDVFDEARYFEGGSRHRVFSYKGLKIGLTICEDIWNLAGADKRRLYHYDPVALLVKEGAELIINISASPFYVGKPQVRESLLGKTAAKYKMPIVYVNAVGGNDELVFDGRSLVVNGQGRVFHEGKLFKEDFFVVDTVKLASPTNVQKSPPLNRWRARGDVEDLYDALVLGLGDYMKKCGFKKAVIGLSGGIDSCVVAALAADAIGGENVLGIAMPSKYSSRESVVDAAALAKNLKTGFQTVPIGAVYSEYLKTLELPKDASSISLTHENIQARIRGNILMAISNKTGAIVLSTGNKSEIAVGYCTLYGDMAGGLAVISDVPKTGVYRLAHYINREREIIPDVCILKPPSAELKPDQKDSDTLPPYETLDKILKFYIEDLLGPDEIVKKGFNKDIVADIIRRVDRNEYKRRQAPPGLKVTSKAFSAGRKYPIVRK